MQPEIQSIKLNKMDIQSFYRATMNHVLSHQKLQQLIQDIAKSKAIHF